jgi:hypothetical protein
MEVVKIAFDKNYNNKLTCDYLWHIDLPHNGNITQEYLNETIIEISVRDASIAPQNFKMEEGFYIDFLKPLGNYLTMISHGMTEKEFVDHIFNKYPNTIQETTQLYCYVYKKITE